MRTRNHHPFLTIRFAGRPCFGAAVLGAASGVFLAFVQPAVLENQWSYPLNVTAFTAVQVWFALQYVGLARRAEGTVQKARWPDGRTGANTFVQAGS